MNDNTRRPLGSFRPRDTNRDFNLEIETIKTNTKNKHKKQHKKRKHYELFKSK